MKEIQDLTIIIITHRNDAEFEQALRSAQCASEVLVVNTDPKIHLSAFEKKYHFNEVKWEDELDFSAIRNFAKQLVKTSWSFWLDSDEIISDDLQREIGAVISMHRYDAFKVIRRDFFHGKMLKHGEVGNMRLLRLIKTDKVDWRGKVHEIAIEPGSIGVLEQPLFHYPHSDLSTFLKKINVYTSLAVEEESKKVIVLKTVWYPAGKFIQNYILKLGCLDGFEGICYAFMMSLHSLTRRVKEYEQSQNT